MLRNRVYLGEIIHKGVAHPGEHQPIVSAELFAAVQQRLANNQIGKRGRCTRSDALLLRKLFDDRGNRMTPVVGRKGAVRYRYYASYATTQGRHDDAGSIPRVSAHDIETKIVAELRRILGQACDIADDRELISAKLERVILSADVIQLYYRGTEDNIDTLSIAWTAPHHRRRRGVTEQPETPVGRFIRSTQRIRLLCGIVRARGWLNDLMSGKVMTLAEIAKCEAISERSVRMTLSLAFLPPAIVKAAISGNLGQRGTISNLIRERRHDWN